MVYRNMAKTVNTPTPNSSQSKSADATAKTADPYEGWNKYTNNQLGYSFSYPADWVVKPHTTYDGKFNGVDVISADMVEVESQVGGMDVTKGSTVWLGLEQDYTGNLPTEFTGFEKTVYADVTENPKVVDVGSYKGVEYTCGYEGPQSNCIRLAISTSKYIPTSIMAEGKESEHPNYAIYKKLLASIK